MAQKVNASIILGHVVKLKANSRQKESVPAAANHWLTDETDADNSKALESFLNYQTSSVPEINIFDMTGYNEAASADFINRNSIWMVIKGIYAESKQYTKHSSLNIHSVLNRLNCPVLLVPENSKLQNFERMGYMADLRYCRRSVVRFMASLADPFDALASVIHLSASGLPNLDPVYALEIFTESISPSIHYKELQMMRLEERNVNKAADVLINGLNTDLLILVNHQYHFREILGRYIADSLPGKLNVPLFIFPF
jgi:hypothetical protein